MKPVNALRVADLRRTAHFYGDGLGFELQWLAEDVAQVKPPEGAPLLLATASVTDLSGYMNETFREVQAGARLYFTTEDDLDRYRQALLVRGLEPSEVRPDSDGRTLEITDPDGHPVSFWQPPYLPDAEVLERFERAPALVMVALEGLSEEQLDLVRAPGKWSIRQTVHHMTDSASSSLVRVLMALAEPGRPFRNNPYSQDRWVANLDAAHRPVGPSVALLSAIHAHVAAIVRHVENGLDRHIESDMAGKVRVRRMLTQLAGHVSGHTEQIWETRRVHGL